MMSSKIFSISNECPDLQLVSEGDVVAFTHRNGGGPWKARIVWKAEPSGRYTFVKLEDLGAMTPGRVAHNVQRRIIDESRLPHLWGWG